MFTGQPLQYEKVTNPEHIAHFNPKKQREVVNIISPSHTSAGTVVGFLRFS